MFCGQMNLVINLKALSVAFVAERRSYAPAPTQPRNLIIPLPNQHLPIWPGLFVAMQGYRFCDSSAC